MTTFPTNIPEIDTTILSHLDFPTVQSSRTLNQYTNRLVTADSTWRQYIRQAYGSEYLDKPSTVPWPRWAQGLSKISTDGFQSWLKLPPRDQGIRLLTEDGYVVLPEPGMTFSPSLRYQDWGNLLIAAMVRKDTRTVESLVSQYVTLVKRHPSVNTKLEESSSDGSDESDDDDSTSTESDDNPNTPVTDFQDAMFDVAVSLGYWDTILPITLDVLDRGLAEDYVILARSAGRVDDRRILSMIKQNDLDYRGQLASEYMVGLVQGGHITVETALAYTDLEDDGSYWDASLKADSILDVAPPDVDVSLLKDKDPRAYNRRLATSRVIASGDTSDDALTVLKIGRLVELLDRYHPDIGVEYIQHHVLEISRALVPPKIANPRVIEAMSAGTFENKRGELQHLPVSLDTSRIDVQTFVEYVDTLRGAILGQTLDSALREGVSHSRYDILNVVLSRYDRSIDLVLAAQAILDLNLTRCKDVVAALSEIIEAKINSDDERDDEYDSDYDGEFDNEFEDYWNPGEVTASIEAFEAGSCGVGVLNELLAFMDEHPPRKAPVGVLSSRLLDAGMPK